MLVLLLFYFFISDIGLLIPSMDENVTDRSLSDWFGTFLIKKWCFCWITKTSNWLLHWMRWFSSQNLGAESYIWSIAFPYSLCTQAETKICFSYSQQVLLHNDDLELNLCYILLPFLTLHCFGLLLPDAEARLGPIIARDGDASLTYRQQK